MADQAPPNGIVLYWYRTSPYARRIAWYLTLRKIQHAQCLQPIILPRPDVNALGIQYRRIPLLAIGRDVYTDTRLILRRLEELFPPSAAHPGLASSPASPGLAVLLQKFTVDMSVFEYAARLIPRDSPAMKDARFRKDRAQFMDTSAFKGVDPKLIFPEAVVHMRACFDVVELILQDGRQWVASTDGPSMADIEGIWPFHWIISDLKPSPQYFSEQLYPKVYAWFERFRNAVAQSQSAKPASLKGPEATAYITSAAFSDPDSTVDASDPLGLPAGTRVQLYPTDSGGFTHQDHGRLVKLTKDEVAISVQAENGQEVRLHAPRWAFRIRKVDEAAKL